MNETSELAVGSKWMVGGRACQILASCIQTNSWWEIRFFGNQSNYFN